MYAGKLRELSKSPGSTVRLKRDNGAFDDLVAAPSSSSSSELGSQSSSMHDGVESEDSDLGDSRSLRSAGGGVIHFQAQPKLSVQTGSAYFHEDKLDIFASPHRVQFQKLKKKYAVRGNSVGAQTDPRATTREAATQAEFDAFANILGVSKRVQLFESARFTEDGPAVIQFLAEYKLSAKFALKQTNVHSGQRTRQEFNLQELKPSEVGELKSFAAQHLSRVVDQHKQEPAIHRPGSQVARSSTKLLQSVLLGGPLETKTLVLRARTDFTNTSHPLFEEYQKADRLIKAQLGTAIKQTGESTAVANLANASLFVFDQFNCQTAQVTSTDLSLDGVMHECTNSKIRQAALSWTRIVRTEIRSLVEQQLKEHSEGSVHEASGNHTSDAVQTTAASIAHAESLLGAGKYSDWISLAQIVRPLENEPVKLSIKMRYRMEIYNEQQVVEFLQSLGVPLDLGYSEKSGNFRPSQVLEFVENKLKIDPKLATFPSKTKRELSRFVFEAQNLQSMAVVRFGATYVELLAAQKSSTLRLADSFILTLEAAERARHIRTYAKSQKNKYAAELHGNVTGIQQLEAGKQEVLFASRDAAAAQIQSCFRAYIIRRSMHHVQLLTAVLQADSEARQRVRHKLAVPKCANIRQWLSGVTPWSLGSSTSRGLLDHHLRSPAISSSLLNIQDLAIHRPQAAVKNELLDLYLEQSTAYSKFSVAEMDSGAISRPPKQTIRFVGQVWKSGFNSLQGKTAEGEFTGASITRGLTGFGVPSTRETSPSELVRSATDTMHNFTSTALSPPGSPRSIQKKMDEFKWNAVPSKLGNYDTDAGLIAADAQQGTGNAEQGENRRGSPPLDETRANRKQKEILAPKPLNFSISPFELLPLSLEQTVDVLLDETKHKAIQDSWYRWKTKMAPDDHSHHLKRKAPGSIYSADPNLVANLPQAAAANAVKGQHATTPASVRFDLPSGAEQLMHQEQQSYDWGAYFRREQKVLGKSHGRAAAESTSQESSRPTVPVESQVKVNSTATPLERVTAFNRVVQLSNAGSTKQPAARISRPPSATVAAIREWQSRGTQHHKQSSTTQSVLSQHKYLPAQTKSRRSSSSAAHQALSPAAKYSRYEGKISRKSKKLSRPQSAGAALQLTATTAASSFRSGRMQAAGNSAAKSGRGRTAASAWGNVGMDGPQTARAPRQLDRSIGNHYAGVWSSNKGQLNLGGQWTTRSKVRLQGFDQYGMAKELPTSK